MNCFKREQQIYEKYKFQKKKRNCMKNTAEQAQYHLQKRNCQYNLETNAFI